MDHSSNEALFGSRVGVDATGEKRFSAKDGIGVYPIEKTAPFTGKQKAKEATEAGKHRLSVVVDAYVDTKNASEVMWRVFNNIDASRDFVYHEGRLAIDATKKFIEEGLKHPWPEDIVMSDEIKRLVDSRWTEYGIDRKEV